ncbi:MAG: pyruvate kinase alpha/beta domain-containing protein [bacterium]
MRDKTVHFNRAGEKNTTETLSLALARAQALNIKNLVIASTTGKTALALTRRANKRFNIVCVTHQAGFAQPGMSELKLSTENALKSLGVAVLRTTHLFAGIDRALRLKFGGIAPAEIVASVYRTFGEGFKVAVEIAVMALDAGLVPYGVDLISIAGTGSGADTAIVIQPTHSNRFFETKIKEIICKPRNF